MDFAEAYSFIYGFVDWEKRGGRPTRSEDIDEFRSFLASLGDPHLSYPTIHVVGTNGKGSVCAMLSSILREQGLNVGLYTSPHLTTVRERIAVNGSWISKDAFACTVSKLKQHDPASTISRPGYRTTFTLLTAAAFQFFADSKVDVAVVEAGLGGRLDATTVVNPEITVITPVHLDHMATLGATLEVIARDKAAVIRNNNVLITAPQNPTVRSVIKDVVHANRLRRWIRVGFDTRYRHLPPNNGRYGVTFRIDNHRVSIPALPLRGKHQIVNAMTAVSAGVSFCRDITPGTVERGLSKTSWPGRLDLREGNPDILLDGAHNQKAVESLVAFVQEHLQTRYDRIVCLFALSRGKDTQMIFKVMKKLRAPFIICNADRHRGVPVSILEEKAHLAGLSTQCADSPAEGLQTACIVAGKKGLVIACGSLYLIGTIVDRLSRSRQ